MPPALVFGVFLAFNAAGNLLVPAYNHQLPGDANCGTSNVMILMAQSVVEKLALVTTDQAIRKYGIDVLDAASDPGLAGCG